jgi:hypothetical protein
VVGADDLDDPTLRLGTFAGSGLITIGVPFSVMGQASEPRTGRRAPS